jgi:hypothetical protein
MKHSDVSSMEPSHLNEEMLTPFENIDDTRPVKLLAPHYIDENAAELAAFFVV